MATITTVKSFIVQAQYQKSTKPGKICNSRI
jgi:hypothetical protein